METPAIGGGTSGAATPGRTAWACTVAPIGGPPSAPPRFVRCRGIEEKGPGCPQAGARLGAKRPISELEAIVGGAAGGAIPAVSTVGGGVRPPGAAARLGAKCVYCPGCCWAAAGWPATTAAATGGCTGGCHGGKVNGG